MVWWFMSTSSSPAARRERAVESYGSAGLALGDLPPGCSMFVINRGQWSMLDAILWTIGRIDGPVGVSVWTWTVAEHDLWTIARLRDDGRVAEGRLCVDFSARRKNAAAIDGWLARFGPGSVRYVVNHAKISRVWALDGSRRYLLRGSMNLNANSRIEQLVVTEGGPEFDLVCEVEDGFQPDARSQVEAYASAKVGNSGVRDVFRGIDSWKKLPRSGC